MLNEVLYGSNYPITNYEKVENKIILHVKSKTKQCKCPKCHQESNDYHATYTRKIQDTPLQNTETWVHVTAYEFKCNNPECKVKTFTEELPFVRKNKVMTNALIQFILAISIFLSSSATSLILSLLGVKVSADTVDNIIHNIKVVDNPDIEGVGIDDIALRKGVNYATAIYDLRDHHFVALLEGRDADSIKDWLKKHPKITVIARDRASAYATAIAEVLPTCMQVADRFHLFQNLVEHLRDIFYAEVPEKIFIKNNEVVEEVTKVPEELADMDDNILQQFDYDNSIPRDDNNNEIIFDGKKHDLDSKQYIEQAKRRLEKKEMVIKLREAIENRKEKELDDIANEFGISITTLLKYKKMSDKEVEQLANIKNYKKRPSKMDDYVNIVYKMLMDNIPILYITAYIMSKGYSGSFRTARDHINCIAKNNGFEYEQPNGYIKEVYPDDVTVITRRELLKHLLTLDEKKKNKEIDQYIDIIAQKYPIVKTVKDIFNDFHDVIFSEQPDLLDEFIDKYQDKISSFCNGLKKDIAPVKNAISHRTISSGFVEGNNNKIKLIKRIVYGKQKLVNLFKKSYLAFLVTLDNFAIDEIVNNVLDEL